MSIYVRVKISVQNILALLVKILMLYLTNYIFWIVPVFAFQKAKKEFEKLQAMKVSSCQIYQIQIYVYAIQSMKIIITKKVN